MIIFSTTSASHLLKNSNLPKGHALIKKFSDGEFYVKIESDCKDEDVWILASTQPPADNILELIFLLDALMHVNAQRVNLFFSYFGYARQAKALEHEAHSAERISLIVKQFPLANIIIMHVHEGPLMHQLLPFHNVVDVDFFCKAAASYDCIAAPDKGVAEFAQKIADLCKKEAIFLHKIRPEHERVTIELSRGGTHVAGKRILLIDDIISTGRTIHEAAQILTNLGAQEVAAAATHGIFSDGAFERLHNTLLKRVYVTNTINQPVPDFVDVYDISYFIHDKITELYNPVG